MKKITSIICSIIMIGTLSSCENWFDVSPKSQIKDLLKDESGYKTALYGVYSTINMTSLYGKNLTYGFNDVLAQYYNIGSAFHGLYPAATYNYSDTKAENTIESIWYTMYKSIMNCNNILDNIDNDQTLFTHHNYQLIKGEALALRAYLHFDLLRLFSPSFIENGNAPAIPYVNAVARSPFKQQTNKAVIDLIKADCNSALALLNESDPIGPQGSKVSVDGDNFLSGRNQRINYWAVKALMARIESWVGNKTQAGTIAKEIIDSDNFAASGIIFSLYSDKIKSEALEVFNTDADGSLKLQVDQQTRRTIYDLNVGYDTRIQWLKLDPATTEDGGTGNTGRYFVTKYDNNDNAIPMIRMSEMYYIYAESLTDENDALAELNTVRHSYSIPAAFDLVSPTNIFADELFYEYRKSMIAEGQLFYFMKRLDYTNIPGATIGSTTRSIYTLPMPSTEIEFGDNIN